MEFLLERFLGQLVVFDLVLKLTYARAHVLQVSWMKQEDPMLLVFAQLLELSLGCPNGVHNVFESLL